MKHEKPSNVTERARVRTRRTALGISGGDLDLAAGLIYGATLRFENSQSALTDKERVVYQRLMGTLVKLREEQRDYGALMVEWMEANNVSFRVFARTFGISTSQMHNLIRGKCQTRPSLRVRKILDQLFDEWLVKRPMTTAQFAALVEAEKRWQKIERNAAMRALIDFEDAA